ncbi:MAG: hypothetical protein ACOYL6_11840 [Bacteriovoracaceae bacterium]
MKMKMITLLAIAFATNLSLAGSLSYEKYLEREYLSAENIEAVGFHEAVNNFYYALGSSKASSPTYSVGNVSLSYGAFAYGSGGGKVNVEVDAKNNFKKLTVDVTVGMLGINKRIVESITLASLKAGTPLPFSMDGASRTTLRISPAKGFNEQGGNATIEFLTKSGFAKENITLSKSKAGKFYIWQKNRLVKEISINMRGYTFEDMYVGKYKIITF